MKSGQIRKEDMNPGRYLTWTSETYVVCCIHKKKYIVAIGLLFLCVLVIFFFRKIISGIANLRLDQKRQKKNS